MRRLSSCVLPAIVAASCLPAGCSPDEPNDLDKLAKVHMVIKGARFELWVVDTPDKRERGLMFITAEQMAPLPDGTHRGMLFVFEHQQHQNFWMKNTIIPLDVAYIATDGTVVATHTMAPLDERSAHYPSGAPARYALEVNANLLAELGLRKGDRVEIPSTALKGSP